MWVGLLGPLLVRDGAAELSAGPAKQRVVLAALGLRPGRVVPVAELCSILWDDAPPPAAPATVRNYVKRLRQVLGPGAGARVVTQAPGYLLEARPDEVDVPVFGKLRDASAAAAQAGDWRRAASLAGQALALWRGAPLADVPSEVLQRERAPALEQMRLQTVEQRIGALLHLGRHAELIPELHTLVAEHPLREAFHEQLMTALYRAGRQGEALAAYQQAWRTLAGELDVEPGPQLRDLHQRILTGDPGLITAADSPQSLTVAGNNLSPGPALGGGEPSTDPVAGNDRSGEPGAAGSVVIPRQLPAGVPGFGARQAELGVLSAALAGLADGAGTVMISAVRGMAGVGKTALVVHWAHQVADRFPDGQLYVDLRGFTASGEPVDPAAVVRGFLDSLGVPAGEMPAGPEAQAGLYRSLLAGRRMLIVLDNARDEDQVRPLLPGSSGCLVVVTSRTRLTGLAVAEGARLIGLDVLSAAESRELLGRRIGPGRVVAEPAAVAELARLCCGLPLALVIVAGRAADQPDFPLAELAAGLRSHRLDALDAGDDAMNVRTVLSWSHRQLSVAAARLFRLLGLHPGPDISAPAAASLAALPLAGTRRVLAELARAHLVTEHQPGRYALHDLLRAYAAEQARLTDSQHDRHEATGRVLDHYRHTASTASFVMHPSLFTRTRPQPGNSPEPIADVEHALSWFEAEHEVLISAIELAATAGFDTCAWQLAWSMNMFLDRRGYWQQCTAIQRIALAAANRDGSLTGQAAARRNIVMACLRLGDYAEAGPQLTACLELNRQMGDQRGEARTHQALGDVAAHYGRNADALGHTELALALFRAIADPAGEAGALNDLSCWHAELGHYQQAQSLSRQALALSRELGNRPLESVTWDSLGYAEHLLGHFAEAAACYRAALALYREASDRLHEADALARLGDSAAAAGDPREADESWRSALVIYDGLNHPNAGQVRAKLTQNGPAQGT